jgi:hypothetical protein
MSKLVDRIGQFTTIPNSVIQLWPKIGVDGMTLFVYLRYRTNAQTETAFPSLDTIQQDTSLPRKRIVKAAKKLEEAGLVERKRRFSASTIYTLKLPATIAISADVELMEAPISADVELPLVPHMHANKIDSNKTEINTSDQKPKTRDIQAAYESCVTYPVDWKAGEGRAAKWLADNGYTPDDVRACYAEMIKDQFWGDKPLHLSSVKNRIGQWKAVKQAKQTIKLTGVVNA